MSYRLPSPPLRAFRVPSALAIVLCLGACGGSWDDDGTVVASGELRVAVTREDPGLNCSAGGARISAGVDADGSGTLDTAEITSVQFACNGSAGAAGAAGVNALVRVDPEAPGANCPAGGSRIGVGTDADGNGSLDSQELASTAYVCSGTAGAAGATGPAGAAGAESLLAIVAESAGANCPYGGMRVTAGVDSNQSHVLDAGEVTSTSYVCNGAPGLGMSWVDVTGNSATMASNTGYLADSAAQVTLTLPPAPAIGDRVSVSGAGSGGWRIAQNPGQSIVVKGVPNNTEFGASWIARETARQWLTVAASADGRNLLAADYGGFLYTSADAGATWTPRHRAGWWWSVALSSDGSKLVAVEIGFQIHTSDDGGVTWTARDSNRGWTAVASSADGTRLVATVYNGQIYTSTDSGLNWTARESNRAWQSVASSADGSRLVAVVDGGLIYTSTDGGVNWTPRESARGWRSVASSADGSKLVAAVFWGQIYTSTDAGATWAPRANIQGWKGVASSADGRLLAAVRQGGQIHTSADSGATWTPRDSSRDWTAVAMASDGNKVIAAPWGEPLYVSSAYRTTLGSSGALEGAQFDSIDLQYIGGGLFIVRGYVSFSGSFVVY